MEKYKTVLATLAVVAALAAAYLLWGNNNPVAPNVPTTYEPQVDDQGEVTVAVEPLDLSEQSELWRFKVTLDTHSRELDEDLAAAAELRNQKDEQFETVGWEGDPAGGHHRSGVLTFRPLLPYPKQITLRLFNIGGVPERTFLWIIRP